MFRLILILGIVFYVIYKIGSFFFRAGAASQQLREQQRRNFDAPVNAPPKTKAGFGGTTGNSAAKDKSGEYIDFEEVK